MEIQSRNIAASFSFSDNEAHDGNLLFTSVYQLFHYEVIWINFPRNFRFGDAWVSGKNFTATRVAKYFH